MMVMPVLNGGDNEGDCDKSDDDVKKVTLNGDDDTIDNRSESGDESLHDIC
jgi:hypothetical protein